MENWTNGQVYDYAVGALGFDFRRMASGGVEMQYPYMPTSDKHKDIRAIDREITRRGKGFIGYVELMLIGDDITPPECVDVSEYLPK